METQVPLSQYLIIGSIAGFVCGLIPLILGLKNQNRKFGILGFILSIIAGIPFSLLGALFRGHFGGPSLAALPAERDCGRILPALPVRPLVVELIGRQRLACPSRTNFMTGREASDSSAGDSTA